MKEFQKLVDIITQLRDPFQAVPGILSKHHKA